MSDARMYLALLGLLLFGGFLVAGATQLFQAMLWHWFGWDWPLWIDITIGFIITAISVYLGIDFLVIVFDE